MCSSTCFLLIVIVAPCLRAQPRHRHATPSLANAEAADDPRPLRDPSGRARWVAQCAALPLTEVRKMAVRDHGLDPQLAALANNHAFPHLHFKGWALPHLWLWGGVNATRARYLAIPKAGSTSVRMALRTEYGHRGQSGRPWKPGAGMWHEDGSHELTEAQRSWFGWTLVADPVSHFIGGWTQASGDHPVGLNCTGVSSFLDLLLREAKLPNSTALATTTHRSHNVHLAPQLHIIRSAIAQFDDSPQQTALSFVAKLSNVSTEWGLLRNAMEAVGARGISGQLPHMRDTRNTSKCRAGMGVHGSAQTFPSASLRILCAYLLEDFVCLDFPFPDACLEKRHV